MSKKILALSLAVMMIFSADIGVEAAEERVIDPDKPMVALTFDDGPSKYTPEILQVLKENNSVATFFVLGTEAERYKGTLNQIIENGNEVGNHTYNHEDLTKLSDEDVYRQVQGTDDIIYNASGYTATIMRNILYPIIKKFQGLLLSGQLIPEIGKTETHK